MRASTTHDAPGPSRPVRPPSRTELTPEAILARASTENFPVALRVLPRSIRRALTAVYGFARLVDETGDASRGDPHGTLDAQHALEALDALEVELDRACAGCAVHPLLCRLQEAIETHGLSRCHLAALIEANRVDQRVNRYASWNDLRGYCRLSAEPVGRLVLEIFDVSTRERAALSDDVCSALQLLEHCQDVSEDLARDRVYMPADDMARFGCSRTDMAETAGTPSPVRALVAFEVERARALLASGAPLVASLSGAARLAVAGYVAGGHATVRALHSSGYDVLAARVRPARGRVLAFWLRELVRAGGTQRSLRELCAGVGKGP